MAEVRAVYHGHEPSWPATDQHPDAARFYLAGGVVTSERPMSLEGVAVVDAIGAPTAGEIAPFLPSA